MNGNEELGFMRLAQVLQVFPVSKSSWWAGVKEKRYPQPVKIGPRTTAWRRSDVQRLLADPERETFL